MHASLDDNRILLSWDYNPATAPAILQYVRMLEGRQWHPDSKQWSVPIHTITETKLENLRKLGFQLDPRIFDALKRDLTHAEELEGIQHQPDAPLETILPLYPFQRVITSYMLRAGSCLNASEVGSGKTLTAIACAEALAAQRILVICPKTPMHQWEKELKRFQPSWNVAVAAGPSAVRRDIYYNYRTTTTPAVLITSYDLARIDIKQLTQGIPDFDVVVADEAHRLGGTPYIKTRKAIKLIRSKHRFALTATPLRSSVLNYYSIIDWIAPGSLGSWKDRKSVV